MSDDKYTEEDITLEHRYEAYLSNVLSMDDLQPYTFVQWYAAGMPHTGGIVKNYK